MTKHTMELRQREGHRDRETRDGGREERGGREKGKGGRKGGRGGGGGGGRERWREKQETRVDLPTCNTSAMIMSHKNSLAFPLYCSTLSSV